MMWTTHIGLLAAAAALVSIATTPGNGQNAGATPHVPGARTIGTPSSAGRPIPSLAVINAAGAKLDGGKLVLTGVVPTTIVFSDRPYRAAGHETTKQFIMQWDEGKDSYGGGVAHWGGVGGTTVARGPADYRGGAAYWHGPEYHGAWYAHPAYGVGAGVAAGAMVGAAAAAAAPRPTCGYYPYPPCH